ncbi:MAG: hypothetical protein IKT16_07155 [Desulfovibrio sp.]|nr:hypothetical protein [Desulfovibrio sp.]
MSTMGLVVLACAAVLLLAGTVLCILSHDNVKQLILRGALHDAGIVCIGLACPGAEAKAGLVMYAAFQLLSRLLALKSLSSLKACACTDTEGRDLWTLRGAGRLMPFSGALFTFGMLAAVGGSAFLVPEGRYLVTSAAVQLVQQSAWAFYTVLLAAAATTVQVWLAVACVNAIMLDKAPANAARPGAGFGKTALMLAGALAVFGLFRTPILSLFAAAGGFEVAHSSAHASFWILYLGAFAAGFVCWLGMEKGGAYVGTIVSALALAAVALSPAAPLSQLFLVLVTAGALAISVYSIGYMAHGERQGWYWFFLLLTFASLAGIVSSASAKTEKSPESWAGTAWRKM